MKELGYVILFLLFGVLVFEGCAGPAEGAEVVLPGDTGYILGATRICAFDSITPENVEVFFRYNTLVNRLEEVGLEGLTQAERALGQFLTHPTRCGTVAMDYRVVVFSVDGDYVLFGFDEGYGFVPQKYITWNMSFVADELL